MVKQVLAEAVFEELPDYYRGKVRENYNLPDERRLIIATDRLSAFDRPITNIPDKGRILNRLASFWFNDTRQICPNHLIRCPDPNVMECVKLTMLPVEIVVRDYLAGSTDTSILQKYKRGERFMYGIEFPDGMRDNEKLPQTIITPTTKSDVHDEALGRWDVIGNGLMTGQQWDYCERVSLQLFDRARTRLAGSGLILADTKYEFGLDQNGAILLADEIHTPDSSRLWLYHHYHDAFDAGITPASLDKDVIRRWIGERCDPYRDEIPEIPEELVEQTRNAYLLAYKLITGTAFPTMSLTDEPIIDRIRRAFIRDGIL